MFSYFNFYLVIKLFLHFYLLFRVVFIFTSYLNLVHLLLFMRRCHVDRLFYHVSIIVIIVHVFYCSFVFVFIIIFAFTGLNLSPIYRPILAHFYRLSAQPKQTRTSQAGHSAASGPDATAGPTEALWPFTSRVSLLPAAFFSSCQPMLLHGSSPRARHGRFQTASRRGFHHLQHGLFLL